MKSEKFDQTNKFQKGHTKAGFMALTTATGLFLILYLVLHSVITSGNY